MVTPYNIDPQTSGKSIWTGSDKLRFKILDETKIIDSPNNTMVICTSHHNQSPPIAHSSFQITFKCNAESVTRVDETSAISLTLYVANTTNYYEFQGFVTVPTNECIVESY